MYIYFVNWLYSVSLNKQYASKVDNPNQFVQKLKIKAILS